MNWKKWLPNLFRIAISIILIVWLIQMASASEIIDSLRGANLWFVGIALVIANLDRLLMAFKWNILLRAKGIHVSMLDVAGIYYKASFWGSLFLPTVGADALRIIEVSRYRKRSSDIISSVVIERFLGIVAVFLVAIFGFFLFTTIIDSSGWSNILKLAGVLILAVSAFLFSFRLQWLVSLGDREPYARWRIVQKLRKILVSYQGYAEHRRPLLFFFLLTILEQFSPIINSYMISKAFHLDIPFLAFVTFIPIIMIAVRLPISFDGFGVRESMYVYLFGLIGVAQPDAFLVGFITSLIARFAVAPFTLYFFLRKNTPPPSDEPCEVRNGKPA